MARNQERTKQKLLEVLADVPLVSFACKKVNIGRATYYRWLKDDTEFATKVNEVIGQGVEAINDMAESKLIHSIKKEEQWAIKFWLTNRSPQYATPNKLSRDIHKHKEYVTSDKVTGITVELIGECTVCRDVNEIS